MGSLGDIMEVRQHAEQAQQQDEGVYVPPPVSSTHQLFEELSRPEASDPDAGPYELPDHGDPAHPFLSETLVGISGVIFGAAVGSLAGQTGAVLGAVAGAVAGWIAGKN